MKLSVVIPLHNEASSLFALCSELVEILDCIPEVERSWEVILVDDASTDGSIDVLEDFTLRDSRLKIVRLATNSGHMAAISAGLLSAKGRWVVTMDGDGQDPPSVIPALLEAVHQTQSEICFARRLDRKNDPLRHRLFSPLFYKLLRRANVDKTPLQAADFRLMSDRVVATLNALPEKEKIFRVLVANLGYKSTEINYQRRKRSSGESKYRFVNLLVLARNSLVSTSGAPLRWLSSMLMMVAFVAFFYSAYAFFNGLRSNSPEGWASLAFILSIFVFIQSLTLGIICEYLLSVVSTVRQRPIFQIKDTRNGF